VHDDIADDPGRASENVEEVADREADVLAVLEHSSDSGQVQHVHRGEGNAAEKEQRVYSEENIRLGGNAQGEGSVLHHPVLHRSIAAH
jgi:hypothetical protein